MNFGVLVTENVCEMTSVPNWNRAADEESPKPVERLAAMQKILLNVDPVGEI